MPRYERGISNSRLDIEQRLNLAARPYSSLGVRRKLKQRSLNAPRALERQRHTNPFYVSDDFFVIKDSSGLGSVHTIGQ